MPERRPECAFVAGATGYTGTATVTRLLELGIPTVAHVRPDSPKVAHWTSVFSDWGATVDRTPWEEISSALLDHRPTHVFALLGTTRKRMREMSDAGGDPAANSYEAVDFGLTAALLRAAEACVDPPHFVYLSAQGVGSGAIGPYLQARVRAEALIERSALPATILRPALITGPDREEFRAGERVADYVVRVGLGLAAGLGLRRFTDRFRTLDASTLARGMIVLARSRAEGVHGPDDIFAAALTP